MAITVNNAHINALLADAAYVGNLGLALTPADLISERMTEPLANYIGENFSVVTQVEGLLSSFDAVDEYLTFAKNALAWPKEFLWVA